MTPPAPTAIDLFAGCGGLSLGLQWAGWDLLCAVERSPMAAETYFANFIGDSEGPDAQYDRHMAKGLPDQVRAGLVVGDVESFGDCTSTIRELLGGDELALLAGGPPCQGFSLAGRRSADDPRNDLVWRFLEAAESLSPLLVLMENVSAIQSPFERGQRANVLADLEEALQQTGSRKGGYAVVRLSLRADRYGVPQRRKRVFLIGVRKDVAISLGIRDHDSWDSERDTIDASIPKVAPRPSMPEGPTASDALWDLMDDKYAPIETAPSAAARTYACHARSGLTSQAGSQPTAQEVPPPNHRFRSHRPNTRTRSSSSAYFASTASGMTSSLSQPGGAPASMHNSSRLSLSSRSSSRSKRKYSSPARPSRALAGLAEAQPARLRRRRAIADGHNPAGRPLSLQCQPHVDSPRDGAPPVLP